MSDTSLAFRRFHDLMPHRVREVLVVSSPYEAFILEQDGFLTERLFTEYAELNISFAPRVTHVPTGEAALRLLSGRRFDLVIVMHRLADSDPFALGRRIKELRPGRPVVFLALDPAEQRELPAQPDPAAIDKVFLWTGDVKILLAIIKFIEDRANAEYDIEGADVQAMILVEDSIRDYSSYFAILYQELMRQSHSLLAEGINTLHRTMRLRARPKILLASTYEEALAIYERFSDNILALITDAGYPMGGKHRADAGRLLAEELRGRAPLLPILVQSADDAHRSWAEKMGASFINKRSPRLLLDLRGFLQEELGFGDFVFRLDDGTEVGRAKNVLEFERLLARVPAESLERHARRHQISIWLLARGEFELGRDLRPQTVRDFDSIEDLRHYLLHALAENRLEAREGVVTDFSPRNFAGGTRFLRLYPGGLGGKARGLAFLNSVLALSDTRRHLPKMLVEIPTTMVIGTDAFDRFLADNHLHDLAYRCGDDQLLSRRFLEAKLPGDLVEHLRFLLERLRFPLAVRSSSLLEDSQFQPFAGIYATYMLPNSAPSLERRLEELCQAVKLVYASTFSANAKAFVSSTAHRIEEEKMAVVLQRVVGQAHGERFYPVIAGAAASHNYYPIGHQRPEDGIALVVLGLGRMVVEGGQALRFSPRHPRVLPQFHSAQATLAASQTEFWAVRLGDAPARLLEGQESTLVRCTLADAEADGTLATVGSVYCAEDDQIRDSLDAVGPRVITFNNVLKYKSIPLASTLEAVVDIARRGIGGAVEVEFAVDLAESPTLYFLQMRPLAGWGALGGEEVDLEALAREDLLCWSTRALGFGRIGELQDVVYVRPERFDRSETLRIAAEVGELNEHLAAESRPYALIGQGRWGSAQHSLGIPVQWAQISGARLMVEVYPKGFYVEPSQGTHFFQNITALRIGYLTVEEKSGEDWLDWSWLQDQPAVSSGRYLRHIRLDAPLVAFLDGTGARAAVVKPHVGLVG